MSEHHACSGEGWAPLLPARLRDSVLRAARQLESPSLSGVLPLAVEAVAGAEGELQAAVERVALTKDADAAADARAAGQRMAAAGDAKGSLPLFTRALQKAPSEDASALAVLYTARSKANLAVGESRAALSDAAEALMLAPLYAKAWRCYAAAHPQPPKTVRSMASELCADDGDESASRASLVAEDEALRLVAEISAEAAAEEDGVRAAGATGPTALVKEGRSGLDTSGRCLVTTGAVSGAGTLLLADQPLALAVHRAGGREQRCHWCTKVAASPLPCSGCADAVYCSRSCRAAASAEHQTECGCALSLLLPAETTLACRLQRLCTGDDDASSTVQTLQSHEANLDVERCVDHCLQAAVAALLLKDLRAQNQNETKTSSRVRIEQAWAMDLCGYLCRIDTNAHAITAVVPLQPEETASDDDGRSFVHSNSSSNSSTGVLIEKVTQERVAVALYPRASLVNHACSPTARVQFNGRQLHLVSATAMRPAGEVTISYGPIAGRAGVGARREQLQSQYHFLCCCSACEDEAPFDADDYSSPDAALDAALGLLDEGRADEATSTLAQICTHQMSLLEAHDAAGDRRRSAIVAQKAAEVFDALGRAYCQTTPQPDYSAAADAIEQALSLLRRSTTALAPGAEPSLAREEHKLATLRFHAAVQAGPGPRGEVAVAAASQAARRALLCVRDALGDNDPALEELTQMVAALGGAEEQREVKQKQEQAQAPRRGQQQQSKEDGSDQRKTTVEKQTKAKPKPKVGRVPPKAKSPAPSPADAPAVEKAKNSSRSPRKTTKENEKKKDGKGEKKNKKIETLGSGAESNGHAGSNDRLILVVVRCVEVLRDSSAVDERLAMATQLYSLLHPSADTNDGDSDTVATQSGPELERLQSTFLKAGGAEVLHARLASMDEGWLAEAKNGAMDLYDKLARLDFVRDRFVQIAAEDEKKVQEAIHANECACNDCSLPVVEERRRKPKSKAAKTKQQQMHAAVSTRRRPTAQAAEVDLGALEELERLGELDSASEAELDDAAILLSKQVARTAKSMQAGQPSA